MGPFADGHHELWPPKLGDTVVKALKNVLGIRILVLTSKYRSCTSAVSHLASAVSTAWSTSYHQQPVWNI